MRRLLDGLRRAAPGTLRAASAASTLIERCAPQALSLPAGLADMARNPFAGWRSSAAEIRRWRLRDVVLDRDTMVLMHRGRVVAETDYLQPPERVAALRVDPARLRRVEAPAVICCDHWDANHYHWLMHGAVQLDANRRLDRPARPMLPRRGGVVDETLHLLGIAPDDTFAADRDAQYAFAAVDYYDYGRGLADFAISPRTQATLDALAGAVPAGRARRLYVDRRGGGNRPVPNETELVEALTGRGFTIIRNETLTLAEQIALFKGAELVVAIHGAGLTNIGFCRPGAFVYELVPSHYINPCFVRMAMQARLRYWADRFASGQDAANHSAGWVNPIDVAAVVARIDEIDRVPPGSTA